MMQKRKAQTALRIPFRIYRRIGYLAIPKVFKNDS
jgi:hypothetical protein